MTQYDDFDTRHYETGRTQPPKSRGGLIAVVLIAVIFLGGLFRAMDSLNISPFYTKDSDQAGENCLQFSKVSQEETTVWEEADQTFVPGRAGTGFSGETLSDLDQQIYNLPRGIYITRIEPSSDAEKKGFVRGDILLRLADRTITDQASLDAVLADHAPGDTVKAVVFRNGTQHIFYLILSEETN